MNEAHVLAMAKALARPIYGVDFERMTEPERLSLRRKAVLVLEELARVAPELVTRPADRKLVLG